MCNMCVMKCGKRGYDRAEARCGVVDIRVIGPSPDPYTSANAVEVELIIKPRPFNEKMTGWRGAWYRADTTCEGNVISRIEMRGENVSGAVRKISEVNCSIEDYPTFTKGKGYLYIPSGDWGDLSHLIATIAL